MRVFRNDKTKIIGFLNDLERSPDTSFERNVVCEEEESFMLTTENLNALRDLHDQVQSSPPRDIHVLYSLITVSY